MSFQQHGPRGQVWGVGDGWLATSQLYGEVPCRIWGPRQDRQQEFPASRCGMRGARPYPPPRLPSQAYKRWLLEGALSGWELSQWRSHRTRVATALCRHCGWPELPPQPAGHAAEWTSGPKAQRRESVLFMATSVTLQSTQKYTENSRIKKWPSALRTLRLARGLSSGEPLSHREAGKGALPTQLPPWHPCISTGSLPRPGQGKPSTPPRPAKDAYPVLAPLRLPSPACPQS